MHAHAALMGAALTLGMAAPVQAADWPANFSKCADEGATCKVGDSPRQVSFGIDGRWVLRTLSGNVSCSIASFGSDPAPGRRKKCAKAGSTSTPPPGGGDVLREAAPRSGWAGEGGGTQGGAAAAADKVFHPSSAGALREILRLHGNTPKIIKISTTLDMTAAENGGPFRDRADQAARNLLKLGSHTTLIGAGANARLLNARIQIKGVENVIVRNLTLVNPCDIAPQWDPDDGNGNWNAAYDGIVVEASRRVWIDHNTFTDAPLTDDKLPIVNGKRKQCHDGALDIKKASDFVTVSNNRFELHSKNTLVGSSDSDSGDEGHLTVTFHRNHFVDIASRTPRVRYGKVHLYNNFHEGDRADAVYPHEYSVGVGLKAKILSQHNAYAIGGARSCPDVVKNPGGTAGAIADTGSLLNGQALNLAGACRFSAQIGWAPPYPVTLLPASELATQVRNRVGAGRLVVR